MKPTEERNLVWNLLELLIVKYKFKNENEFLDPTEDNKIIFGNFISGHPMSFEGEFKEMITELTRILPSKYDIVRSYIFDDSSACIGLMKIE